ncbi:MAG: hypothetical protein RL319_1051 [Actinomycetota bacterium]
MPDSPEFHGVRSNFVLNANGEFKDSSGSSRGLSNAPDFQKLLELRSQSNLIITDAVTAAREAYRPSKYAPIEIWSKSGNFRGLKDQVGMRLIETTEATELLKRRKQTFQSIVLECGPTLTRVFAKSHLIDELRVSVVGKLDPVKAQEVARTFAISIGLAYLREMPPEASPETYFFTFKR